jgi:hypothetical protein
MATGGFVNPHILPIDILADLSTYMNAHHLAKLWFCGDASLNALLTRPGVVPNFDLCYEPSDQLKWPTLISQFPHLNTITIKIPRDRYGIVIKGVDMSIIPKNVQWLDFFFQYDLEMLLRLPLDFFLNESPSHESIPVLNLHEYLPNLQFLKTSKDLRNSITYFNKTLPIVFPSQLTTLYLPNKVTFHPSMINSLPRTLTRMDITICSPEQWDKNVSLPPTLAHLILRDVLASQVVPTLPPHLTSLSFPSSTNYDGFHTEWHPFPTDLLYLTISVINMNLSFLKALPPTLLELHHDYLELSDKNLIQKLPRTLEYWSITLVAGGFITSPEEVQSILFMLPPSLKHLPSMIQSPIDPTLSLKNFPHLERLELSEPPESEENTCMSRLPKHLKSLTVKGLRQSDFQHLPKTITSLHLLDCKCDLSAVDLKDKFPLTNLFYNSTFNLKDFSNLPATLQTLKLRSFVDLDCLALALPRLRVLVKLHIFCRGSNYDHINWFKLLPPTLKILWFRLIETVTPTECLQLLPPSLTEIFITKLSPMCDQHLENLPQKLKIMQLWSSSVSTFTVEGLQKLPPSLTQLKLSASSSINNTVYLPINRLSLPTYSIGGRDFDTGAVPKEPDYCST